MNQTEIGKFIAKRRKEKQLTQAQLAEKLNITDRAVSKWETGKCMPDSSVMLELCGILGITVNELLSGEEVDMESLEKKADENLIALKRKDENNMTKNVVVSVLFSMLLLTGIMICLICNLAVSGRLTWSSGHFVREKRDCHELRLVKRFFDSLFIFTEQAGRGKAGVFGRREDRGSFRLISVGHGYHFRPRQEKAGGFGNCFPDSRSLCAWRQYRAVKNDRGTHL